MLTNRFLFAFILLVGSTLCVRAQVDDMCREFGVIPSLDSPFQHVPYVYGRVVVKGLDQNTPLPRVSVIFIDRDQTERRVSIQRSGNYCFRRSGGAGTLVVEVDGVESTRRSLPAFGAPQLREDFEIQATGFRAPPGAVSAKFSHPRNEKTVDLYAKTIEAEKAKDMPKAIEHLKEILAIDAADFIAWAKLGSMYFERGALNDADAAFRKSLELRVDYTPAWINVAQLRMAQKQLPAAIEIFKHALTLDPQSARTHRLLGEAYLQAKQGTLAVDSLNQAIKLDPIGMAECHLLIARLYDLAGAKKLAAKEYKQFLDKVPGHPDRPMLQKYIDEHSK